MKNNKIISALFLLTLLVFISACKKDFLDKEPYDSVPFDDAIKTENDLSLAVNGIYASMRTNEMYGRTLPMIGDVMADNVYISTINTGRYLNLNSYLIISSNGEADEVWRSAYTTILRANQAINSTITVTISAPNVNQLKGEAYTLRALMYFDLVRTFARPYSSATINDPGVPLVLTYDPNAQPQRNSIGEVYSQVISDLNTAIGLLTINKNSEYVSLWVAKALLAKVYQYKGDWNNAKTLALEVVNNSGYQLADSADYYPFWKNPAASSKSETLFEISCDATNNNGTNSLTAMYFQPSYGDALCDSNLYKLFSTKDVRRLMITPGNHHGQPCLVVKKYTNQFNAADKDDAKVLRLSEIYLLLAEAYYNLGDEPNALNYLNIIAQKREPTFAGYASSGTTLLDDITSERRKELAFEGNRFFDLNRLGLDINRGLQYPPNALYIPFTDHRRIMPIPLVETDANPNITQNPGY